MNDVHMHVVAYSQNERKFEGCQSYHLYRVKSLVQKYLVYQKTRSLTNFR